MNRISLDAMIMGIWIGICFCIYIPMGYAALAGAMFGYRRKYFLN